jgi:hypothetical protein
MDKFTFTASDVWLIVEKHLQQHRLALMDDMRTAISNGNQLDATLIEGRMQSVDWVQALPEILFPKEEKLSEKETSEEKRKRW